MASYPFQIYNASAGSGKTFTLVKEYLKIVLGSPYPDHFKQILAITFTNKAVAEMKERVVKNLKEFSSEAILTSPSPMFSDLASETGISPAELHKRSGKVLKRILHHYAFFDIVTIDKFNHRLLRTFAFDLKLPLNFEVVLDAPPLLEEAVDRIIYKVGQDPMLTNLLIDFALEKADDDKSWDIARDLQKIARLLLQENYNNHVASLKNMSLKDFASLANSLRVMMTSYQKQIQEEGSKMLTLFKSKDLLPDHFSRGTLYNHFKKISEGLLDGLYNNKLEENLTEGKGITPASAPAEIKATIDFLLPEILSVFKQVKQKVHYLEFLQNFYKNLLPLSLLNMIRQELELLKKEQNLVLISDFNNTISEAVANQPAPFIYERLGEKYRHYFIDEFQDTSGMQWENLKPLVANALESETLAGKQGTLFLVGDAKQSIYRWRGGKAEQFMALYNGHNPFQIPEKVFNLPVNYRSHQEIVLFNNAFFRHIAQHLTNEDHRNLFENQSSQDTNTKVGGFVSMSLLDKDEATEETYCRVILEKILLLEKEYSLGDICVLTRKKSEGLAVASYLSEHGIPIISSETLLLKNDRSIAFLINLMKWITTPDHKELEIAILFFLAENAQVENIHDFISENLSGFETYLEQLGFHPSAFTRSSLYSAVEYAISVFNLHTTSEAYIVFFLDLILEFVQQQKGSLTEFLDYWERKKDTLSIVAPQGMEAVQIMTIHKSKGLEFPVVIYPFAETDIYREPDPKIWLPVDEALFSMPYALLNKNTAIAQLNEEAETLYNGYQSQLEFDQYNILYVALTRAVECLFIIGKKDIDTRGMESLKTFSGLFINFLKSRNQWDEHKQDFNFGSFPVPGKKESASHLIREELQLSFKKRHLNDLKVVTKSGSLWETTQQKAIEKGNLYHSILSSIQKYSDLEDALESALLNGVLTDDEKTEVSQMISKLFKHPDLESLFDGKDTVMNEKEIYTAAGESIRPDRINIRPVSGDVIISDYKTGSFNEAYRQQLQKYASALKEMGYKVSKIQLVFINESIEVLSFSV